MHIIGKNITRFHCLYWPAMLMSAGLPLPRQVFAHGFMLDKGAKMSKTRGNVLDPDEMAALFGVDGVRYVVLREVPFDRDADVSYDGFVRRYNADLANDFGNLLNRTLNMTGRYLDGERCRQRRAQRAELARAWAEAWPRIDGAMERFLLRDAPGRAVASSSARPTASSIAEQPWQLAKQAKNGDAEAPSRLQRGAGRPARGVPRRVVWPTRRSCRLRRAASASSWGSTMTTTSVAPAVSRWHRPWRGDRLLAAESALPRSCFHGRKRRPSNLRQQGGPRQ